MYHLHTCQTPACVRVPAPEQASAERPLSLQEETRSQRWMERWRPRLRAHTHTHVCRFTQESKVLSLRTRVTWCLGKLCNGEARCDVDSGAGRLGMWSRHVLVWSTALT